MASISPTSRPGYVYDSATDTWIPIGIGPHTHQATDLSGVVDDALIDAKGDLIVGSAADTPARLAVGNNGETLVADSSASTGLRWQADFAAGKNKIINGDFTINQRNFSSTTTYGAYGFDRFWLDGSSGTTYSAQTFTPGTAPVAGYEGRNFARLVTASQSANGDYAALNQRIEDVRTLAGQTVTLSLWAKASTGTPKIGIAFDQHFGAGGSSNVGGISGGTATISSSWARYSFTVSMPSLSGKTIGTGSYVNLYLFTSVGSSVSAAGYPAVGLQNVTIDLWGVQLEAGSTATAFQTATGTLAGELAACQRYYYRAYNDTDNRSLNGLGWADSSTVVVIQTSFPVQMRTRPTAVETTGTASNYLLAGAGLAANATGVSFDGVTTDQAACTVFTISSGGTAGRVVQLRSSGANRYIAWSAEL